MPEMNEDEMRGRAFEVRRQTQEDAEKKKQSLRKHRVYASTVRLRDLDSVIQTTEHVLDVAKISYVKRELDEKYPQRRKRTDYLSQLLSSAELKY